MQLSDDKRCNAISQFRFITKGHAMVGTKLETVVRGVAVILVAAIGLLAATPNVHGTVDSRGGAPCDVNKTISVNCGSNAYTQQCLYNYTSCYSTSGWRFMTCSLKPLSTNSCEKDVGRCFPRDDYMPNGNCTPSFQAPGAVFNTSTTQAPRLSEVE
jgi:hypothetical protein